MRDLTSDLLTDLTGDESPWLEPVDDRRADATAAAGRPDAEGVLSTDRPIHALPRSSAPPPTPTRDFRE
jgi:hypothetical protein